jgi:hypothetical protein
VHRSVESFNEVKRCFATREAFVACIIMNNSFEFKAFVSESRLELNKKFRFKIEFLRASAMRTFLLPQQLQLRLCQLLVLQTFLLHLQFAKFSRLLIFTANIRHRS